MEGIVDMVRDAAESGGRDRFSCTVGAWLLLIELAETFGWRPRGTIYVPEHTSGSARHDYRPGDAMDRKRVEVDDAIGWATALDKARRSPHFATLIGDRPGKTRLGNNVNDDQVRSANAPFTTVMDEFVAYAYGGAFSFAISARQGTGGATLGNREQ